jgi:transcriptional regulator with XRE-family HTH domain
MAKTLHSPRHQRLITLLVEARRSRGFTQVELAAALGRPQSFIAKVERGERRLEIIEFGDLARALGIDPGELLTQVLGR